MTTPVNAKVEIYTRDYCGYCTRAKALLDRKGVTFVEIDGSPPDTRREMIQRSQGGATYPQIFINGVHVGGSDELHDLDDAGKLDPLLAQAV
ncbi:MAG: glutaredoxin 3 [Alphaproteobacteria bacterium]